MRILFLNYEYPPLGGGAANATQQILKEYAKRQNIQLDLVTASVDKNLHIEKLGDDICIHKIPIGKNSEKLRHQSQRDLLAYAWESHGYAKRLLQKNSYDVIHAFFTVPCGFTAMLLAKKFSVPFIVSLRGSDVPGYSKRFTWMYKVLKPLIVHIWKRADRVVANSAGLRDLALTSSPQQPIDVIFNGVNTEKFTPREKKEDSGRVFLLFASRLMQRKGVKYIIRALHLLHEKYPQLRLIIAGGDGDASDDLRRQVKELHLEEKVEFTGHYYNDDLPGIQHRGDIFVYPSFNEGMSNNVLEAMAGGLPIIMTPTGGAKELISEGENGYIVDFGNGKAIAEKIEILINDEALRETMGQKSREKALELSWKKVADKYVGVYEEEVE